MSTTAGSRGIGGLAVTGLGGRSDPILDIIPPGLREREQDRISESVGHVRQWLANCTCSKVDILGVRHVGEERLEDQGCQAGVNVERGKNGSCDAKGAPSAWRQDGSGRE